MNDANIICNDYVKYGKDCKDFKCLDDGTITGEYKYCEYSTACRQVDIVGGVTLPMEANYLQVVDDITGKVITHELFCTGMHDLRPLKERIEDNKVS